MRLLYFVNVYPAPAATYIAREINALRASGVNVAIVSIRRHAGPLPDECHRQHSDEASVLMESGFGLLVTTIARVLLRHPLRTVRAAACSIRLARRARKSWLHPAAYLVQACLLLDLSKRNDSEFVHVQMGSNAASVARVARRLGAVPYTMMVHGPEEFDQPAELSIAGKIHDSLFTTTVSRQRAVHLRSIAHSEDHERIHVIRCGLDSQFLGADVSRPGVPAAARLVCVARLAPRKGHLVLLEAVRTLVAARPEIELVCIGDGESRDEIAAEIERRDLRKHVALVGALGVAAVIEQLRMARALVLPSFDESLPSCVIEAMAMRRPVICSNVGSVGELVEPGVNGWLVPARSSSELALAMEEMLTMPTEVLTRMGDAGLALVRSRYDLEDSISRLMELYAYYQSPR